MAPNSTKSTEANKENKPSSKSPLENRVSPPPREESSIPNDENTVWKFRRHETSTSSLKLLGEVSKLEDLESLFKTHTIERTEFGIGSSYSFLKDLGQDVAIMPKFGNPLVSCGCHISILLLFSSSPSRVQMIWEELVRTIMKPPRRCISFFDCVVGSKIYKWPDKSHTLSIWLNSIARETPYKPDRIIRFLKRMVRSHGKCWKIDVGQAEQSDWYVDWSDKKNEDMALMAPV